MIFLFWDREIEIAMILDKTAPGLTTRLHGALIFYFGGFVQEDPNVFVTVIAVNEFELLRKLDL